MTELEFLPISPDVKFSFQTKYNYNHSQGVFEMVNIDKILQGDCKEVLQPVTNGSVALIVTSQHYADRRARTTDREINWCSLVEFSAQNRELNGHLDIR